MGLFCLCVRMSKAKGAATCGKFVQMEEKHIYRLFKVLLCTEQHHIGITMFSAYTSFLFFHLHPFSCILQTIRTKKVIDLVSVE